jgi:glutamate/tyrosine decarboxylase-like PLP-dependent enzyme
VWLHVDAAWAGSAAILPEQRAWFVGLEAVNSYSFSVHKCVHATTAATTTAATRLAYAPLTIS